MFTKYFEILEWKKVLEVKIEGKCFSIIAQNIIYVTNRNTRFGNTYHLESLSSSLSAIDTVSTSEIKIKKQIKYFKRRCTHMYV